MKSNALLLAIPTLLCFTAKSFAFFCPNNFNQINIGDTIQSVEAACGKPAKITKKDAPDNSPQEWNYYVQQTGMSVDASSERASIKTNIAFDNKGKAVNITMNNISTGSAKMCGTNIKIGMTREQVEAACGKPGFVNKQTQENAPQENNNENKDANKLIEYLYNSTPPVTLVFQDGKLSSKR